MPTPGKRTFIVGGGCTAFIKVDSMSLREKLGAYVQSISLAQRAQQMMYEIQSSCSVCVLKYPQ